MDNPESISLDELINALLDESKSLPARFLYRFSDISPKELKKIEGVWTDISVERRRGLLEDLEELEDSNTIVSFKSVCTLALTDEDAIVRKIGIRALWNYEDPSLIPPFMEILDNDPDIEVRAQAAYAFGRFVYLGEMGQISAEKVKPLENKLLEIMDSDEAEILRRRALESLGYSGRASVRDLIEDAFQYGDDDWVASALFAMGRSADNDWAPNILEKMDDSNPKVRLEAVRAAAEMTLDEATPSLLYLLEGDEEEIRLAAAWALSEIGGDGARDGIETLLAEVEEDEEIDLIERTLENLALTDEIDDLELLDISKEDFEDLLDPPSIEDS